MPDVPSFLRNYSLTPRHLQFQLLALLRLIVLFSCLSLSHFLSLFISLLILVELIDMGVHLHLPQLGQEKRKEGGPPKGFMAIRVGQEGEEQQRFVVPVEYVNHPLFKGLLKEAEEEYGFEQKGAITIPCHVEHFRQIQGIIDRDTAAGCGHHHGHHFLLAGCFKA